MFNFNADSGQIKLSGIIGDDVTADQFDSALDEMGGQDITIRLRSEGGDVIQGMSMANAIERYPGQVRVEIDALAASIATVFPMAADHVAAYQNSTVMIHKAWTFAVGNSTDLRLTADILDRLDGTIADMYARKTGGDAGEFMALMEAETFYTAAEAQAVGLVDSIIDGRAEKPKNALRPVAVLLHPEEIFNQLSPARPRAARVGCLLQSMKLALGSQELARRQHPA